MIRLIMLRNARGICAKMTGSAGDSPGGKETARACNACAKTADNLPRILKDYLMETTGNVPEKLRQQKGERQQRNY